MNRKTTKTPTGGTMFRAPSYFVWNQRKHASSSPRPSAHTSSANTNMNNTQDQDGTVGESGPSPRKMRSPRRRPTTGADNQSTDTKSSVVSGDSGGLVTISPKHKDPDRIKKDREREERVRQAREKLELERKRKLVDLQEQQRQAQENREKQLEMRRRKIEDLRRRDVERRAEVEKRRRDKENAERSRRETLLLKAEERVARYEAWKRNGQKALNTIPEGRRSVLAPSAPPPTRPKSVVTLNVSSMSSSSPGGTVKLRENKFPRKPRPASVGTSMPSFVTLEPPKSSSQRSKSTDRLARERSRPRSSASARRTEEKDEKKGGERSTTKMSRRTLERLSTPRQVASVMGDKERVSTPKREAIARKSSTREKTPRETSAKPQQAAAAPSPAGAGDSAAIPVAPATRTPTRTPVRVVSPTPDADEDGGSNASPARSITNIAEKPSGTLSSTAEKPPSTPTAPSDKPSSTPNATEKQSGDISAEEYKARLAEKRRQAREKAEREAEEERKRQEELLREEEEKRRQEEEEQRRQDEEAMRLAEAARKAEEERLQKAIEAEEARRAEEAARMEQERLAKEEAERKAKEEAERLELEKQEKARRDEEERQERKKRLEMIMKRVKTDSPAEGTKDGSSKSVTSSPAKSINSTASSDTSPTDPENKTVLTMAAQSATANLNGQEDSELRERAEDPSQSPVNAPSPVPTSDQQTVLAGTPEREKSPDRAQKPEGTGAESEEQVSSGSSSPVPPMEGATDKPKFKSPLLQKLVEGKEEASSSPAGGPRFKSPLLQNLLSKTKLRSMGSSQDQSVSDPNLSHVESRTRGVGDGDSNATLVGDGAVMSSSMVDMGTSDSSQKEARNSNEEKEVDTSEESSSASSSPGLTGGKHLLSNGEEDTSIAVSVHSHDDVGSITQPEPMEISTPMESSGAPALMAASTASFWSQQDSGVVLGPDELRSAATSGSFQVSFNGHGPARLAQTHDLEDSSISMRSVESVSSSITDSAAGSVFSSVTSLPPGQGQGVSVGDRDFEELIELPVNNKASTSATTPTTLTVLDNPDDLVNFNKLVVEEGSEQTTAGVPPPPIIAFEDRRQDVPDLLS